MHAAKWDGPPDLGDHHGFLSRLGRSSAWSFHARDDLCGAPQPAARPTVDVCEALPMTAAVAAAVPAVGGGSQAPDPRRLSPQCWLVRRLLAQIIRRADMSLSVVRPPERRSRITGARLAIPIVFWLIGQYVQRVRGIVRFLRPQGTAAAAAVYCEMPGGRKISEDALTLKGGRP